MSRIVNPYYGYRIFECALIETGCGLRDTDTEVDPRVTYLKWSFSYQIN